MSKQWWFVLVSIVVFALALRIPLLNGSFWLDEAAQALQSARPWSEQLNIRHDFQPPLLHVLTHLVIQVSSAEWWLRTWGALIPGLVSIICSFFIARSLLSNKHLSNIMATLAALLVATSSLHVLYSQELRPYALPLAFASASWLVLIKLRSSPIGSAAWWWRALVFALVSVFGLYASYLYPFVLIGQLVYIISLSVRQCSHYKYRFSACCQHLSWLVIALLVTLGFLPWLPSFLDQLTVGQQLRTSLPNWETVVSTTQWKALALVGGKFIYGVADIEPQPIFVVSFVLIVALLLWIGLSYAQLLKKSFSRSVKTEHLHVLTVICCWLVIPIISAWLISFLVPVVQAKRVLFALPAWYLLIALLSGSVLYYGKRRMSQTISLLLTGLLFTINLFTIMQYWTNSKLQRENWRAAYQDIQDLYDTTVPKIFVFDAPFSPWVWYTQRANDEQTANTFSLQTSYAATPQSATRLVQEATDDSSQLAVLYFDYMTDLSDPNRLVLQSLTKAGYTPTDLLDYPNIGFIRLFEQENH